MPALYPLSLSSFESSDKYTLFHLHCNNITFPLFSPPLPLSKNDIYNPHEKTSLLSLTYLLPKVLSAKWLQAVFYACNNNIFSVKIYLSHKNDNMDNVTELDIKPSDALVLSLIENIDLYCTDTLVQTLEKEYSSLNSLH